ncbi:MAG TPA: type II toxin-antitoxin system RelE/ParE family toxin [Bosea sp. (in: a-proteobacteria)]|jgi:plasmid stabilization system protein ParE|nr:type II toxin-antitoxin system RelE/ParE family toxin [Bosea sp. (in: a-proteobacteria)]
MSIRVRFSEQAIVDLQSIFDHIAPRSSERIARDYVTRLYAYCLDFQLFPERGVRRDDLRPGLRLIGYRRQATIAFAVLGNDVTILRVFQRGRDIDALLREADSA